MVDIDNFIYLKYNNGEEENMKRFSTLIILLLTLCGLALPVVGCKKMIRPSFTAEKPVYTFIDLNDNSAYKSFIFEELPIGCDPYWEFLNYYNGEFKSVCNKHFYILDLGEPDGDPLIDRRRSCYIYGNISENLSLEKGFLTTGLQIYDKEIGGYYDKKLYWKDGWTNWSIKLEIICSTVNEKPEGDYVLEFGKLENDGNYEKYIFKNYINIYCGNVCVATCFYVEGVKIPLSWYENYFKNNLIYGGNL